MAAGFQEAVADVLTRKAVRAATDLGVSTLLIAGGVAANSRLRARLTERVAGEGIELGLPALSYCTDNAAMIAAAGQRALEQGRLASFECEAMPNHALPASSGGGDRRLVNPRVGRPGGRQHGVSPSLGGWCQLRDRSC